MKVTNNLKKKSIKTMLDKVKLKRKIKKNVKQKNQKCDDCERVFSYKKALESHKINCKNKLTNDNNNVIQINGVNGNQIKSEKSAVENLNKPSKELDVKKRKALNDNDRNENNIDANDVNSEKKLAKKTEPKTEYICYSCGLVCKDMVTYKEHCKSHITRVPQHIVKKYTDMYKTPPKECPICHREQKGLKQAWLRHLDTHNSDVALHHCRVCKKGFRRADHRNKHEKRHIIGKIDDAKGANDDDEEEEEEN